MEAAARSEPIRVLIADDHVVLRAGLRRILELEPDIRVVGEAQDGWQAVELAARLQPDVVLMDLSMPGLNGLEAMRRLGEQAPSVRVVALTVHGDDAHVVAACRAGAWGYLAKTDEPSELVRAIRQVAAGEVYFPSRYVASLVRALRQPSAWWAYEAAGDELAAAGPPAKPGQGVGGPAAPWALTAREAQVLALIAQGCSNREIARRLVISEKTVKNHVTQILRKLGLKDRTQAAIWAVRCGLPQGSGRLALGS